MNEPSTVTSDVRSLYPSAPTRDGKSFYRQGCSSQSLHGEHGAFDQLPGRGHRSGPAHLCDTGQVTKPTAEALNLELAVTITAVYAVADRSSDT